HDTGVPNLGDVPHAPQDAVRDPRRAAGAACDLVGRIVGHLDSENPRAAPYDRRELLGRVVVQSEGQAEAIAERRRQKPRARGRADERERRQVERQRARGRSLADDDVEPEVLERRVEDLLDCAVEAVDLVDEEDVARLERRQDRGDVALPLERGPGDLADADAELAPHDLCERRLAEARRPGEQQVVECVAPPPRCVERDRELLLDALLADEVVERRRPQRALELLGALLEHGGQQPAAHAAFLSASRTCSSTGSAASTPASALSASGSDHPSSTSASRAVNASAGIATSAGMAIFSRSSSTTRCAVLRPMPGIASKRAVSSRTIARRSSAGAEPETIASATFGPTPETPRRSSNSSRSSADAKP